jgi:hypothetical protein
MAQLHWRTMTTPAHAAPSLGLLIHRDARILAWLFAALFSVLAFTNAGFDTSEGDSPLAAHLLATGRLGSPEPLGAIYARGPDGLYYPSHDLGATLPLVPVVALGRALASVLSGVGDHRLTPFLLSFLPGVYIALAGVALFAAVRWGWDEDAPTGVATAALGVFCTILWPYSRNLFEGVLATTFTTWLLALLLSARATKGPGAALLAGACLGCAAMTRIVSLLFAPAAVAWLGWVAWRRRRRWTDAARAALLFGAAAAPFLLWEAYYNWLRTGYPLVTPLALPQYAANNALDGNILVGLAGFAVSPGKAIVLFSPILAAALWGLRAFLRERPADAWLVAGAAVPFLVAHAALRSWSGDWGWGARYAIQIVPWLLLPAVVVVRRALGPSRAGRRWLGLLVAASLVVQLGALVVNWHYRYMYLAQTGRMGPQVVWSVSGSQLTDALVSAGRNLERLAGRSLPYDVVRGASPLNVEASNTLNVWWLTAVRAGVPAWAAALAALLLLAAAAGSWRRVLRLARAPAQ